MNRLSLLVALALLPPVHARFLGTPSLPKPPSIPLPKPPSIPIPKPPPIKIPTKPEDLDPRKTLEREVDKARAEAMKTLNRFSPETVMANVRRSIQQGISKAEAQSGAKYDKSTGEIDLRGTKVGRTLRTWLEKFAQGNESKGEVEQLSYNVRTQVFKASLYARHHQRQKWGILGHVDIYSVTQRAKFSFDFKTKNADYDLDLGKLAPKIDKRSVEALAKGDLVTVAEAMAPDLSAVVKYERKNDYADMLADLKRKHGADNVYMSSKPFVNWAGSKTMGKYLSTGVLSGGSAVWPQIMQDAREQAQKELPQIVRWLEGRGAEEGEGDGRGAADGAEAALAVPEV